MAESVMRIKTIYCYPIKSLQGCTFPSLTATTTGFAYDRRFMLQKTADGKYMQISKVPEMSLFTTELVSIPDPSSSVKDSTTNEGVSFAPTHIHVRFKPPPKSMVSSSIDVSSVLEIPLEPVPQEMKLESVGVDLYGATCVAYDMGTEFQQWFSDRFGYGVRLLYVGDNRRPIPGNVSPDFVSEQQQEDQRPQKLSQVSGIMDMVLGWIWALLGGALVHGAFGSLITMLSDAWIRLTDSDKHGRHQPAHTTTYKGIDAGIGFADVAPYLVATAESHQNIVQRFTSPSSSSSFCSPTASKSTTSDSSSGFSTKEGTDTNVDAELDIDISRFRPNIVLEGANEPFEEDFWAELQIDTRTVSASRKSASPNSTTTTATIITNGDDKRGPQTPATARIHLTANCPRCTSLNVDPRTGRFGEGQSGKVLAKMQKDRRVDAGMKYSPVFGRYGFLAGPVGDNDNSIKIKTKTATTANKNATNSNHHLDGGENEHEHEHECEDEDEVETKYVYEFRVGDTVRVTRRNTEHTVMIM